MGLITAAVGVSAIGDFLLWIPLALHLQEQTGSAAAVAGLFIALWAPVVLLAPVAGLLVDRLEARGVLLVASLAQAAVAAALAFSLDSTAAILGLAALLGAGFAVAQPAEFTLVPVIATGRRLTEANGLVETARYAGSAVGPLAGGLLAGLGGTEAAMLVNAASFAAVALAALLLRARRPTQARVHGAPPDRARDGVAHLFADQVLRTVMSVAVVALLFMTATVTAEVFFIKEDLGASDLGYGLLFSTWMAGMAAGALLVARRVPARLTALGALVAVLVQGLGVGLPAAWVVAAFAAAMWLAGGLAHGTKNVLVRTLIAERVPARVHGRAFAAYNGMRNGAELVALAAGGVLVATVGARVTLAFAGAIPVLAALAGLAWHLRRTRWPDPALADARAAA
jgi:MFS family permease